MTTTQMVSKTTSVRSRSNSPLVLVFFWIVILFELTTFKYIWEIRTVGTATNIAALLVWSIYTFKLLFSERHGRKLWYLYILPGLLVYGGMLLNVTLNAASNVSLVSYFGSLIPWLVYLSIPGLVTKRGICSAKLWHYFYYFMVAAMLLGLVEYYRAYTGQLSIRMVSTPNGDFGAGWFSLFYLLRNGSADSRLYACFPEPGTLGMFLLPAIAHAYFLKKYIGLAIFLLALYFTASVGALIGIVMMIPLALAFSFSGRGINRTVPILILVVTALATWIYAGSEISDAYERKGAGATEREDNAINTIRFLPDMLANNPLGFTLTEGTASDSVDSMYFGNCFTPGNALQMGGISAFIGYIGCLLVSVSIAAVSITRKALSLEEKTVFCSLIVLFPFIIQRSTVWESSLFALLFAPSIVRYLQSLDWGRESRTIQSGVVYGLQEVNKQSS